jgi:hypothetical protein
MSGRDGLVEALLQCTCTAEGKVDEEARAGSTPEPESRIIGSLKGKGRSDEHHYGLFASNVLYVVLLMRRLPSWRWTGSQKHCLLSSLRPQLWASWGTQLTSGADRGAAGSGSLGRSASASSRIACEAEFARSTARHGGVSVEHVVCFETLEAAAVFP